VRAKVEVLEAAEADLLDGASFLNGQIPGLGDQLVNVCEAGYEILTKYPEAGFRISKGLRKWILPDFPYSLIYAFESSRVIVVAIAHHRRRPGYWKRRVQNRARRLTSR
jgi:toxin ParE1/3/4